MTWVHCFALFFLAATLNLHGCGGGGGGGGGDTPTGTTTTTTTGLPTPWPPYTGETIWMFNGRGAAACQIGGAGQQHLSDAKHIQLGDGNAVTIKSSSAAKKELRPGQKAGCLWTTSRVLYDLSLYSRIEVDVKTKGTGQQWFSLWLDPQPYGNDPSNSGEIDLIENLKGCPNCPGSDAFPAGTGPGVRTNFAGCSDQGRCNEVDWVDEAGKPVDGNAVNHHITAVYDKATTRLEVYHCARGLSTCPKYAGAPFIVINQFPEGVWKGGRPMYYLVADVWNADPDTEFELEVSNLKVVRDSEGDESEVSV